MARSRGKEFLNTFSIYAIGTVGAKLIAFAAENTGLLYLLYFTALMIATVNAVKVYAAIAIAVII